MIKIKKSKTADTRSCDYAQVTKEQLRQSSLQHMSDVRTGIHFFRTLLYVAAEEHDKDKLTDIDGFHSDFLTGFEQREWWNKHRGETRHHLLEEDGVPDVNLIDVLEMIVDCVMAGMGRTGTVYPFNIKPELLIRAFDNTVLMLKKQIVVEELEVK